jgi:2,3-bisphosphoglycerate-independent phosphoglycerate mutase
MSPLVVGNLIVTGVGGDSLANSEYWESNDPETCGPHTAHTTNPVPVLLLGGDNAFLGEGRLADIAPTLLELMGLRQPVEMSGRSLLRGVHASDQTSPRPSTSAIE